MNFKTILEIKDKNTIDKINQPKRLEVKKLAKSVKELKRNVKIELIFDKKVDKFIIKNHLSVFYFIITQKKKNSKKFTIL